MMQRTMSSVSPTGSLFPSTSLLSSLWNSHLMGVVPGRAMTHANTVGSIFELPPIVEPTQSDFLFGAL